MKMYAHINETYDGTIIADARQLHDHKRLSEKSGRFLTILSDGTMDTNRLSSGLVIWRKIVKQTRGHEMTVTL